jgi:hypothetical protein
MGMDASVFQDITPCSLLKFSRRFEGICSLNLQDENKSTGSRWFLAWHVPSKLQLTSYGLHAVVFRKTEVKLPQQPAVEAHWVVRRRGSNICCRVGPQVAVRMCRISCFFIYVAKNVFS